MPGYRVAYVQVMAWIQTNRANSDLQPFAVQSCVYTAVPALEHRRMFERLRNFSSMDGTKSSLVPSTCIPTCAMIRKATNQARFTRVSDCRLVAPPSWYLKSSVRLAVSKKSCDVVYLIFNTGSKMRVEPRSS